MTKITKTAANNVWHLTLLVVFSWLIAAGLFALIEHVDPLTALYWSMTTMSTVGYGDVSAGSALGKIMTIVFQAWSIFYLVPCAVANIIDKVLVNKDEFTHAEQEWQEDAIEKIAAKLDITLDAPPRDY